MMGQGNRTGLGVGNYDGLPQQRKNRRSIRLRGYDYSKAGAYFVTICTQNRVCLFGDIVDGKMVLNEYGKIIADSWQWLATQYDHVELDEWVIMPNHMHGIIVIVDDRTGGTGGTGGSRCTGGSRTAPTLRKPIGRLIGAFKTVSTKHINQIRNTPGTNLWQRNYYEHIVRNENELNRIRQYIIDNPVKWKTDRNYPIDSVRTDNVRAVRDVRAVREPPQSYGEESWMI